MSSALRASARSLGALMGYVDKLRSHTQRHEDKQQFLTQVRVVYNPGLVTAESDELSHSSRRRES